MPEPPVIIDVLLNEGDAERGLKDLETQSRRTFRTFENESRRGAAASSRFATALGGLRRAMGLVAPLVGLATMKRSVDLFRVQEQAVQRVTGALALQGVTSRAVVREMEDYASALQSITTFGDEAYLAGTALALNMGATVDQAKELTAASADLAAALGTDLDTAVRQLARTLGGMRGELGEKLPGLAQFSPDQLRAGAAIGYVRERFSGTAATLADTPSGRYQQALNTFGDELEKLGQTILPAFAVAIKGLNRALQALGMGSDPAPVTAGDRAIGEIEQALAQRMKGVTGLNSRLGALGLGGFQEPGGLSKEEMAHLRSVGENIEALRDVIANARRPYDPIRGDREQFLRNRAMLPRREQELAQAEAYLRDRTSSHLNEISATTVAGIENLNALLDQIGESGPQFDAAKALFDAINAPDAQGRYDARLRGIDAARSLHGAVLAEQFGMGPNAGVNAGAREAADLKFAAGMEFLADAKPEVARFSDDLGLSVRNSVEGGVLAGLRGGGARGALEAFSTMMADQLTASVARAIADGFMRASGIQKGIDSALLSLFGPGGEAGAGATP